MKKITYEQNGVKTELDVDVQTFGPSLIWDLAMSVKNETQKKCLLQIHGLLTAIYYGKVEAKEV